MSFPILKLFLVSTNFFLTTFLLILTCDHFYSNYDTQSWGFIFHLLSLAWLFIRGIFWLATMVRVVQWTTVSFYLLYWLPAPLEFAAFMLLPLYFTQILYPEEWRKHWFNVRPFYLSLIVGMIIFQVLWTWLADSPAEQRCTAAADANLKYKCFQTEDPSDVFRIVTGICFVFVAIMQFKFGQKILELDAQRYAHYFTTPRDVLANINKFLAFAFATRSVYQFLSVLTNLNLPNIPIEPGEGDVDFWVFVLFELWVYAPTMLIVLNVTSRTLRDRTIADVGYTVIARTYGAIDPLASAVAAHPADMEDGVDMRLIRDESLSTRSRQVSAAVPIQAQGLGLQREDSHLLGSTASNHSSLNRTTWLSDCEVKRYYKPGSSQQDSSLTAAFPDATSAENACKLSHYYTTRLLRSGSVTSEASEGLSQSHQDGSHMLTDQQYRAHSRASSFGSGNGLLSAATESRPGSYRAGGMGPISSKKPKQVMRFYNESGKSKRSGSIELSTAVAAPLEGSRSSSLDRDAPYHPVFLPTLSSELVRETQNERDRTPSIGREMELFHQQAQQEIQQEQLQLQAQIQQEQPQLQAQVHTSPQPPPPPETNDQPSAQHYELQVEPGQPEVVPHRSLDAAQQTPTILTFGASTSTRTSAASPSNLSVFFQSNMNTTSGRNSAQPTATTTTGRTPPLVSTSYKRVSSRDGLSVSESEMVEELLPPGYTSCFLQLGSNRSSNNNLYDYCMQMTTAESAPVTAASMDATENTIDAPEHHSAVQPELHMAQFGPTPAVTVPLSATLLPRPSRPSVTSNRMISHVNSADTPPLSRSVNNNPIFLALTSPSPNFINTSVQSSRLSTPQGIFVSSPMNLHQQVTNATLIQNGHTSGSDRSPNQIDSTAMDVQEGPVPVGFVRGGGYPSFSGMVHPTARPGMRMDAPVTPDSTSVSYSPGSILHSRLQAQTTSSTPDRMEAAREAARLRQGLGGGRHSQSFTFSPANP